MDTPSAATLKARARRLLDGEVIWFPVRHHSPACAWHVREIITARRPFAVLVEGPPSFDEVIPHLVDPAAAMPLAVYAYVVQPSSGDEPGSRRAGLYYPLCDYSPELAALRAGAEVGARLGFADLDYTAMVGLGRVGGDHALVDEHAYAWSAALGALADDLGCRDHNELWDHLIEAADHDTDGLVAAVAAYGWLARFGDPDAPEPPTAGFDASRERAMVARVRTELAARAAAGSEAPIVVVTGAFHTAVLPELLAADSPVAHQVDVSSATEAGFGVVRYGFERLDALAGYAAGMPSPGWYQTLWEAMAQHGPSPQAALVARDAVLRDVAEVLRDRGGDGQPATPTVVDAHVHAELLARLRGRGTVARDDVADGVLSCYSKGEFALDVRRELGARMTGDRVGRLAPGTPRTPLAVDFDRLAAGFRLPLDTSLPRRVELALHRDDRDRHVSRFLHSLDLLRVAYGSPLQLPHWGRGAVRDVTREIWSCQLTAETDPTLAEAALWGSTVADAVDAALRARFHEAASEGGGSGGLMALVRRAVQCGAFTAVEPMLTEVRAVIATDPSLPSVAGSLAEADLLWTGLRPLDGGSLAGLPALGEQMYLRACALLPGLAEHDVDATTVSGVRTLHQVVTTATWLSLDETLYWDALEQVRLAHGSPQLAGAVDGVCWHGGRLSEPDLLVRLAGHLATSDDDAGADYLAGLVATAREVLWQVEGLLGQIDAFLDGVDETRFVRRLPQLRAVFALLTPRETDRVAEQLGQRYGVNRVPRVEGLGEAALLANLAASTAVAEQLVADGLGGWLAGGER